MADHYFFMDDAARAVEQPVHGRCSAGQFSAARADDAAGCQCRFRGTLAGRQRTDASAPGWRPMRPTPATTTSCAPRWPMPGGWSVGIHIHAAEDPAQTASSLAKRGLTPIQVLEADRHPRRADAHRPRLRHPAGGCGSAAALCWARGRGPLPQDLSQAGGRADAHLSLARRRRGHRVGHGRRGLQQHAGHLGESAAHGPHPEVHRRRSRGDDRPRGPGHRLRGQRGGDRDGAANWGSWRPATWPTSCSSTWAAPTISPCTASRPAWSTMCGRQTCRRSSSTAGSSWQTASYARWTRRPSSPRPRNGWCAWPNACPSGASRFIIHRSISMQYVLLAARLPDPESQQQAAARSDHG